MEVVRAEFLGRLCTGMPRECWRETMGTRGRRVRVFPCKLHEKRFCLSNRVCGFQTIPSRKLRKSACLLLIIEYNGLGTTPPRGWRSCNQFDTGISQPLIESQYEALGGRTSRWNPKPLLSSKGDYKWLFRFARSHPLARCPPTEKNFTLCRAIFVKSPPPTRQELPPLGQELPPHAPASACIWSRR